jgi:hypothetical protein
MVGPCALIHRDETAVTGGLFVFQQVRGMRRLARYVTMVGQG